MEEVEAGGNLTSKFVGWDEEGENATQGNVGSLASHTITGLQIVYAAVCLAGVLGNLLVIYCMVRFPPSLHTVTNTYVLNLAVADLAFLAGIPALLATMAARSWPLDSAACALYSAGGAAAQLASTLFLTALAVDRYIAVCHPHRSPALRTPRAARVVCLLTWAAATLHAAPHLLCARAGRGGGAARQSCRLEWPNRVTAEVYTLYSLVAGFSLPCLTLLGCYGLVVAQLWCCGPTLTRTSPTQRRLQAKV